MSLITAEYQAEQAHLHQSNPNYGVMGGHYAEHVANLCQAWRCNSLLDYGAGKQSLKRGLDKTAWQGLYVPYDPAIAEINEISPLEYQMVACIDVLEHIEPDCLEDVLIDLKKHTHYRAFFTIHTGPAQKTLSDGRNAHLTQQPARWWLPRLCQHWNILLMFTRPNGFEVGLEAL